MKWIGAWLLIGVVEFFLVWVHAIDEKWDGETIMRVLFGVWLTTGIILLGIWCIVAA